MSAQITAQVSDVFWGVVTTGGDIQHAGTMTAGLYLTTGNPTVIFDADIDNFKTAVDVSGAVAPPMPALGEALQEGGVFAFGGNNVVVRLAHERTADAPASRPDLFAT